MVVVLMEKTFIRRLAWIREICQIVEMTRDIVAVQKIYLYLSKRGDEGRRWMKYFIRRV